MNIFIKKYATANGEIHQDYNSLTGAQERIRELSAKYSHPDSLPMDTDSWINKGITKAISSLGILGDSVHTIQCDRAEASSFRRKALQKIAGHYSERFNGGSKNSQRFQLQKCGNKEFSIRIDATRFDRKPMADGFADVPPSAAPSSFNIGCCILEAKYARRNSTIYAAPPLIVRNIRNSMKWTKGGKYAKLAKGTALIANYTRIAIKTHTQMGKYIATCQDPEIPATRTLYIVNITSVRDYVAMFMATNQGVVLIKVSKMQKKNENWIV